MQPLTPDDLLPLEDYVRQRADWFATHFRYLDRYRRIRIGPSITLLFENRQTLWFRAMEMIRILRLTELEAIAEQLEWFNLLMPRPECLQAAVIFHTGVHQGIGVVPDELRGFRGEVCRLQIGDSSIRARLLTDRPADHAIGSSHWLEFAVPRGVRGLLGDYRVPACFALTLPKYQYESAQLSEDVRQSLLDDLELAEQAAA